MANTNESADFHKAMAKAAARLLDLAGDEFGNHGCNDFDLNEIGLTKDEQIALVTFMNERNRSPENTAEDVKHLPHTADFAVMFACAEWCRQMATKMGQSESMFHRLQLARIPSEKDPNYHAVSHVGVGDRVIIAEGPYKGRRGMILSWRACEDEHGFQVMFDDQ